MHDMENSARGHVPDMDPVRAYAPVDRDDETMDVRVAPVVRVLERPRRKRRMYDDTDDDDSDDENDGGPRWRRPRQWTLVTLLLLVLLGIGIGMLLSQTQRLHTRLDDLLLALGGPLRGGGFGRF